MCVPWLGCCVRFSGLVSGLFSGLVSQLVSHPVWDAVSALSLRLCPVFKRYSGWVLMISYHDMLWTCFLFSWNAGNLVSTVESVNFTITNTNRLAAVKATLHLTPISMGGKWTIGGCQIDFLLEEALFLHVVCYFTKSVPRIKDATLVWNCHVSLHGPGSDLPKKKTLRTHG